MHDLMCGFLLGAVARYQVVAQIVGWTAGGLVGSVFSLILVPDPAKMLMTEEWPAPAVAQWKAVAEVFLTGIAGLPRGAITAMWIAAALGVVLPVMEKLLPKKASLWVPSGASLGLALVIPAHNSISMFLGGLAALVLGELFPKWHGRSFITLCAGIIAGESLVGAGDALRLVPAGN